MWLFALCLDELTGGIEQVLRRSRRLDGNDIGLAGTVTTGEMGTRGLRIERLIR